MRPPQLWVLCSQLAVKTNTRSCKAVRQCRDHGVSENLAPVLDYKHEMNLKGVAAMERAAVLQGAGKPARLAGRTYRLYPTDEQEQRFEQIAGCCRAIWNAALEQRRVAWKLQRLSIWANQQAGELPALKRDPDFAWLGTVSPSHTLQQTLRDLDIAYRRFFRGQGGFPKFKRKGAGDSFRIPQPCTHSPATCRCASSTASGQKFACQKPAGAAFVSRGQSAAISAMRPSQRRRTVGR